MLFAKNIEKLYKNGLFTRQERHGAVFFFTPKDFDGLKCEPYSFSSSSGHTLSGYFYSYADPIKDRLIVFDHGMGAGHLAYMKEIELLARHGYLVFSYDHTGCAESGGKGTNGFTQSLHDLDDCITALKSDERYKGLDISVVGHSWGAFSTMNIAALHPEISRIVAIAGFIAVEQILKQNFSGIMRGYAKPLYELEKQTNPKHYSHNAVQTLKNAKTKALLIYSDDDPLVKKEYHYDVLKEELKDCDNVQIMLVNGKAHNPNYTAEAVRIKDEFFAEFKKRMKKHRLDDEKSQKEFVASYDWDAMTRQDEAVWAEIFEHLDK